MKKVILIHANCLNPKAKGDFAFAGNIAKDTVQEISKLKETIDVILVSTVDGISRLVSLYGPVIKDRLSVEGIDVGLCSLGTFDAVGTVIAYIDANRCRHTAAYIIKRVICPESKFLFVGNINQQAYTGLDIQASYCEWLRSSTWPL